jgi:hypothetical protein
MNDTYEKNENNSFEVTQCDRILARTLAIELTDEALAAVNNPTLEATTLESTLVTGEDER